MNLLLNIGDKNYASAYIYQQFVLYLLLKNTKLLHIKNIYILNDSRVEVDIESEAIVHFIRQPVYTKSNWLRKKWHLFWEAKKINALAIDYVLNIEKPYNKWIKQPQFLFLNEFSFLDSGQKERQIQSLMGFKKIFPSTPTAQAILYQSLIHSAQVLLPFFPLKEWSRDIAINGENRSVESNYFVSITHQPFEKEGKKMLKAFSMFKKWQLSQMKYYIIVNNNSDYLDWEKQLELYKYKADIIVMLKENIAPEDFSAYIRAAYALVYTAENKGFPFHLLQYFAYQTPIIAIETVLNKAIFNDSIAWAEEDTAAEIAELMVYLYKNETYRNQLIPKMDKTLRAYSYAYLLPEYKAILAEHFKQL